MMVDRTEEHVKKISESEERLKGLEEDLDDAHEFVNTLSFSLRQENDELQTAKVTALQSRMLHKYGTAEIGVKNLGELNTEGWYEICKDKFNTREVFDVWVSEVDDKLRKHTFRPIRTVPDGEGGEMKMMVDEDDETLTMLRNEYGPVVTNSVGACRLGD